ncbi:MAG: hypothetical protein CMP22_01630 [Rickettsiales bacterium]|nr:hypothetical protein [Rickettsiales bacterium]|tara:strand:- start:2149 stop:2415 length:267 start_codon:yes stop_codon:yes gene_type:complete
MRFTSRELKEILDEDLIANYLKSDRDVIVLYQDETVQSHGHLLMQAIDHTGKQVHFYKDGTYQTGDIVRRRLWADKPKRTILKPRLPF